MASCDVVLGVLGELVVRLDGDQVPAGHVRQRSVLAVLAVDVNRVVPTDALVDRVWGERPPVRARSVLRTYLTHLRRAVAPCGITIVHRSNGYLLEADPDVVDLHRFRRLVGAARSRQEPDRALAMVEEALTLWRGEALAELDTPWAFAVKHSLERERVAAEIDGADWALACGRHIELLPVLAARVDADPLDERLVGQQLLALYRAGRQADALFRFREFRERLVDQTGVEPGPELRRLHGRILDADPALVVTGVATTAQVKPRQLPAAPKSFIGRDDHLAVLDEAVGRGTTVVVGGAGGMGKTWLIAQWAHAHVDRFSDGQLFVDLRGFAPDGDPALPGSVVRGFLDALGVDPDSLPDGQDASIALFRSVVAERKLLIVLDNAADTAQVAPLLPGSGLCTVVVTSRQRLAGLVVAHDARYVELNVLTGDESRALLAHRLGSDRVDAEPDAVLALVESCGGFPLALSIVAARAHLHPATPLAEFAAELREFGLDALAGNDPASSLPTVLSWSYRALTTEQQTAFALLGIAPGADISLNAAACLLGTSPAWASAVLRTLDEASLITAQAGGRYRSHDLVRRYAAETARKYLDASIADAALRRLVDFYLHSAYSGDRIFKPFRDPIDLAPLVPDCHPELLVGDPVALAWFASEHHSLLAAQKLAARRGWYRQAWQLAWAMDAYHARRGHVHETVAVWRIGFAAAEQKSDPSVRILAHRLLGNATAYAGLHDEAITHLERGLVLARQRGDRLAQAHLHNTLSGTHELRGDDRTALAHSEHALELYQTLGMPEWTAGALNGVGWQLAHLGEHERGRSACTQALALAREHGLREVEAVTLDSLGYIAHSTADHEEALDHYRASLAVNRTLDNTSDEADTLVRLGETEVALGRPVDASASWSAALDLYRKQGRSTDADRVSNRLDALGDHQ